MPRKLPAFAPDSPLVTVVRPGLGYTRGKLLPRMGQAVAVIGCTGGRGGQRDPADYDLSVEAAAMSRINARVALQSPMAVWSPPASFCHLYSPGLRTSGSPTNAA